MHRRVHTFKISVYPAAILPMLAVYGRHMSSFPTSRLTLSLVSTTMEAIGDITASAEVSRLKVTGDDFDSRIQGGVLVNISYICVLSTISLILVQSDGLGGFVSALFTVTPLSIFAQVSFVL